MCYSPDVGQHPASVFSTVLVAEGEESAGQTGGTGGTGTTGTTGGTGSGLIGPKPSLATILTQYQVPNSPMTIFDPSIFVTPRPVTQAELAILEDMSYIQLLDLNWSKEGAYAWTNSNFPVEQLEDGHGDAARHCFANVLVSHYFGAEFALAIGNAHEMVPGNPPPREAMDLYNNGVGIRIQQENPNATIAEWQNLVMQALANGDLLVIDLNGDLAWSNEVTPGNTGHSGR